MFSREKGFRDLSRGGNGSIPVPRFSRFRRLILAILVAIVFLALFHDRSVASDVEENILRYLSLTSEEQVKLHNHQLAALHAGLAQCAAIKAQPVSSADANRRNPRAVQSAPPVLIKNATLIDGDGSILSGLSILLSEGIVKEIGDDIKAPENCKVIEVGGRYVSPGLVDMHSHAGVDSLPELFGTDDTNEISGDVTPYVRTIDAINPSDEMFQRISSGGITTSLILPGSANNIGGEAYVIKLRQVPTVSVEDMLLQKNITTKPHRWIKMACGENPKRVYGNAANWPGGPNTRLGEAWRFRQTFERARALMNAQDNWCLKAQAAASTGKLSIMQEEDFPSELELDVIVGVLRGDVRVNVHCYETMDLEAMLRHAAEFNFIVTAFHHALDAWRVPEMLHRGSESMNRYNPIPVSILKQPTCMEARSLIPNRNITVATFSMLWGYKKEAFQANPWAGKILAENNIPVAYKSDHPVLNAQHLLYEAQIGHHYGLPDELAIASLTSVPAKALGMDHRIGYLRVGYDADVVIWDSHPLALGATPIQVFIDGIPLFDEKTAGRRLSKKVEIQNIPVQREFDEVEALSGNVKPLDLMKQDFIATGIKKAYLRGEVGLQTISTMNEPLTMVVRNGKMECLSSSCHREMQAALADGVQIQHLRNGYILPGLTVPSPSLGLAEIGAERSTYDGFVSNSIDPTNSNNVPYAKDGLTFDGKHLERAQAAGILNIITPPLSGGFLQGVSAAFKSGGKSVLEKGAVIQEEVALHLAIGHGSRGGSTPSVSSQIALLRKILVSSANDTDSIYGRAANGKIPLAITAQNKDVIAHLLKLKSSLKDVAPINLVIIGGIESYLLAEELSRAQVPVILIPWRCQPEEWEYRHCLPGPPISDKTSFQILVEHGVKVALGAWDDGLVSTMYWEAAWAAKGTGLKEKDVVELISTKVEEIAGIKWKDSADGGHVLFEGNPLDFGASVAAIIS